MFITSEMKLILQILADNAGWMTGQELIDASDGELGKGNVYACLQTLRMDLGCIQYRERQRDNMPPTYEYQILGKGKRVLTRRRRWRKWLNIFLPEPA